MQKRACHCRGISEEVLNVALQKMGKEIPSSSLKLLQWAAQHGVDFRLISDCNTLFISQILTGPPPPLY